MAKNKPKNQENGKGPSTSTAASKNNEKDSGIWQDSRFQHLLTDPRFKNLPKAQRKVKIDKRFQSMFTDNKFKVKYTVDKYGRRVNQSNAEDLKKYYELDSNEESESDVDTAEHEKKEDKFVETKDIDEEEDIDDDEEEYVEEEQRKEEKAISSEPVKEGDIEFDNDELVSDSEEVSKPVRERLFDPQIDYARGEGRLITDSSSDDESTEDEDDPDTYMEHTWGELDAEAERTDESTYRLAVCNMDWDRIRALDLMMLFNSFLPPGGSVLSVKIFLSEYGKERTETEERHGPPELIGLGKEVCGQADDSESNNSDDDNDSEDDVVKAQDSEAEEGDEYHMEKLRQYQLNRLRYYYAVVECDSVATADKLYAECDGLEYESSATRIDLRFIPDDTTFEDEPTDECTELPDSNSYQPRLFTNTALQQAKVDLTWDETAVERRELSERLLTGKLEEVDDKDLRKIVAYSSEEGSESEEEVKKDIPIAVPEKPTQKETETAKDDKPKKSKKNDYINKYKALLAEINEKEQEEKKKKYELEYTWKIDAKDDLEKGDKDIIIDEKPNSELTPIERELKKRNEKNKQRKLERKKKKLVSKGLDPDAAENDTDSDSIPDGIDMNDPYFAEEFANGDYVDPNTKRREQKKKKQLADALENEEAEKQAKELELLLDDDDEEQQGKQHFSLDKILKSEKETKSKRKRRAQLKKSKSEIAAQTKEIEDNFKLNLEDDRFRAVYSSPLYNIDPTHSHFKKTKGMELMIHEKLKRRHGVGLNGFVSKSEPAETQLEPESKKPKRMLEQTLLVKSLKRKLQAKLN